MSTLPLPIAAFVAGLFSFLSPCVLPLVPGYLSLISGAGIEELKTSEGHLLRKVMLNSAAFIIGFSIVFITLGAISTEVGQVLAQYKSVLARIAGVIIILFGLHLTGIFQIKALLADTRLHTLKGGSSAWGAFVIGFAFAFGWTPCVGPILAVVLGFAAAQDTVWKGIVLLAIYSAGLAVPFLGAAFLIELFLKFYSRFKFFMHAMEVASGCLLIALGILLVLGRFTIIAGYFSFLNRFAL
jgi:cytochrome c-type biogenesis protein